jgi:hypothetical protein
VAGGGGGELATGGGGDVGTSAGEAVADATAEGAEGTGVHAGAKVQCSAKTMATPEGVRKVGLTYSAERVVVPRKVTITR